MAPRPAKLSRNDPAVRAIVRSWRRLTTRPGERRAGPGQRTLVACSGGADSSALALALATAGRGRIVIGHVVHDLRPRAEALADRDAARALADALGVEFTEAEVQVRSRRGNSEAAARAARYAALAQMAVERGITYIATAHHADDQLETVLMSLLRGSGGGGLRGIAARRRLVSSGGVRTRITLIRPMLTEDAAITREACRGLCAAAGVAWREDATNQDVSRLRAGLRHGVIPAIKKLRPDAARRAIAAASHAREVDAALRTAANGLWKASTPEAHEGRAWKRGELRRVPASVLGELIRIGRASCCGSLGADRVSRRVIAAAVRAIRDRSTDPRSVMVGGMYIRITAGQVRMARTDVDAHANPASTSRRSS